MLSKRASKKLNAEKRAEERNMRRAAELANNAKLLESFYGPTLFVFCNMLARGVGVHVTMLAPVILAVCSGLCGYRSDIVVDPDTSWTESYITWTVGLAYSACGKTPCVNLVKGAVDYACRKLSKEITSETDIRLTSVADTSNAGSPLGVTSSPSLVQAVSLDVLNNGAVTFEATHLLLYNMHITLGIVVFLMLTDEMGRTFNALNQYKGGQGTDRDDLISMYVFCHIAFFHWI